MATIFNVQKMMCTGCSANIEKVLSELSSVESVSVNLANKTASVEGEINVQNVAKIISDAGYPATLS